MLDWLFGKKKAEFPTKVGVNAVSCVSLLDLHGSLFCLDNQNILFYENKKAKVLQPVMIEPASELIKLNDFDAYDVDEHSFAIRYKGLDYFYHANFEVTKIRDNTYIKLTNIKQPIIDTFVEDGCIVQRSGDRNV